MLLKSNLHMSIAISQLILNIDNGSPKLENVAYCSRISCRHLHVNSIPRDATIDKRAAG